MNACCLPVKRALMMTFARAARSSRLSGAAA